MTERDGSGEDPMAEDSTPADTAHAMKTATRYQQQELQARGRFGRSLAADDVPMADARTTMQTDRAEGRFERVGYEIDADAVAKAIVNRLLAGGMLAPPRTDDR